jgi:hypothetical protein
LVGRGTGNLRFGVAYVGDSGWVEADASCYFRLREQELGLDLRGFLPFATRKIDSFGVHLGLSVSENYDPGSIGLAPVPTQVNEIGINLGAKVASWQRG